MSAGSRGDARVSIRAPNAILSASPWLPDSRTPTRRATRVAQGSRALADPRGTSRA
jgi:hypothetical protein